MAERKRTTSTAQDADNTPSVAESNQHFVLDPHATTSIVNGNRVIVLSKGITAVEVARSEQA